MRELQTLVETLAPAPASIVAGDVASFAGPLMAGEGKAVARAVAKRRDEFRAGRAAARAALRGLGWPPLPLPAGPDRAPVWPDGVIGSISHTDGAVAAVTVRKSDVAAIGLDIEHARPLDPKMRCLICSAAEGAGALDGLDRAMVCFVIKEAAFKAYNPATGHVLDFREVRVEFGWAGRATVLILEPDAPAFFDGRTIPVRYGRAAGLVAAVAAFAH